jgi:zinc transport system permease protein
MLDHEFMRLAFGAGAVVGVLAPAVGFFLVQRRMSLIGDGIGHVAFAGVALGYLLGVAPVATALVASVAGAIAVEWLRTNRRTAGDQALALLFYTGIAAGVVIISSAGALNANLFSFLFGSILTVTRGGLLLVAVMGGAGLEEGARVSGLPVGTLNVVVAGLAGVTIALSMRIVGILLIAALMVLPVTAAGRLARSVAWTFALAMAIGLGSVFVGLTISYYADLAPGGAIVLVAAGAYVAAAAGTRLASRA